MDIIKETHINPGNLQTLGKILDKLDNIEDRISEHKKTTI